VKAITCCLALVLVVSGCATSDSVVEEEKDLKQLFVEADKNRDGKVTRDEFVDFMIVQAFERADGNRDGVIELDEFGGTKEVYRKLNHSTGDGKVTLADALASPFARQHMAIPFDEADVNDSGAITWDEFEASRERAQAYTW